MGGQRLVFSGYIAGFGTSSGVRLVIGHWTRSPFGAFTDVMVQTAADERILLAPGAEVADFVSDTYQFDRVEVDTVTAEMSEDRLEVTAGELSVAVGIGGPAPLNRLLRLVPARLAVAPWWLSAIDPVASRIVPGVHTAGSAGQGRREYYGVRRSRRIVSVSGNFGGHDLGAVAPLLPAVGFGFSSAPPAPQIVAVTTTIDVGASAGRFGRRRLVGEHRPQQTGGLPGLLVRHDGRARRGLFGRGAADVFDQRHCQ